MMPRLLANRVTSLVLTTSLLVSFFVSVEAVPRPFSPADIDGWRTINNPRLSRDGAWLAYSYMPRDGDGDLVLRETATDREHRLSVGDLPPPPDDPDDESPEEGPPQRSVRIALTSDSRFALSSTYPAKADYDAALRKKLKGDKLPQEGIVIVDLANGASTRIDRVKSMQVPAKGGSWLAYLKFPATAPDKETESETPSLPPALETSSCSTSPRPLNAPSPTSLNTPSPAMAAPCSTLSPRRIRTPMAST
jgi:hypothetical protein